MYVMKERFYLQRLKQYLSYAVDPQLNAISSRQVYMRL